MAKIKKLKGKVAIITGCSGGISKKTAIRFAEEEAKLVICARTKDKLNNTAEICRKREQKFSQFQPMLPLTLH